MVRASSSFAIFKYSNPARTRVQIPLGTCVEMLDEVLTILRGFCSIQFWPRTYLEVFALTIELYKLCLHVVRAGTLGWLPWTYCTYPDLVSMPPILANDNTPPGTGPVNFSEQKIKNQFFIILWSKKCVRLVKSAKYYIFQL